MKRLFLTEMLEDELFISMLAVLQGKEKSAIEVMLSQERRKYEHIYVMWREEVQPYRQYIYGNVHQKFLKMNEVTKELKSLKNLKNET